MPIRNQHHAYRRRRTLRLRVAIVGLLLGCGGDIAAPQPDPNPSQLYWALALDHHAVNLSIAFPHDTLQLTATPRNTTGVALADSGTVVYTSSDLSSVRVSPGGLLQAVAPGTGVTVVASLTVGNLTHTDTTVVNVTSNPNPPDLASLSIHPVPPDSAKRGAAPFGAFYPWPVTATDTGGNVISDLAVACSSSDPTIASIPESCGFIQAFRPGHVFLATSTTAYGVTRVDTVALTVGLFSAAMLVVRQATALGAVTIATGGTVTWFNQFGQPIDVTFNDPTNVAEDPNCQCGAGNIAPFSDARSRLFPIPGTYVYHSSAVQDSGTIVVSNDQ